MKYSLQKRISAFVLAFALVMTTAFNSIGATTSASAAVKVKAVYKSTNAKAATVVEGTVKTFKIGVWTSKAVKKATVKKKLKVTSSNTDVVEVTTKTIKATQKTKKNAKKAGKASVFQYTAVKAGTATITAKYGKKKASFKVTVTAKSVEPTPVTPSSDASKEPTPVAPALKEIKISANTNQIDVGGKAKLTVESGTADVSVASVTYSSDNGAAEVDANGVVLGKAEGTAIITAVAKDVNGNEAKASISIEVKKLDVTIALAAEADGKRTLSPNQTYKFSPVVTPATWTVEYESSDDSVASVSADGTIVGHKAGTAIITATALGTAKRVVCNVTVVASAYGIASAKATHANTVTVFFTSPIAKADQDSIDVKLSYGGSDQKFTKKWAADGMSVDLTSSANYTVGDNYIAKISGSMPIDENANSYTFKIEAAAPVSIVIASGQAFPAYAPLKIKYSVFNQYGDEDDSVKPADITWYITPSKNTMTHVGAVTATGNYGLAVFEYGIGGIDTSTAYSESITISGTYSKDSKVFGNNTCAIKPIALTSASVGVVNPNTSGEAQKIYAKTSEQVIPFTLSVKDEFGNDADWGMLEVEGSKLAAAKTNGYVDYTDVITDYTNVPNIFVTGLASGMTGTKAYYEVNKETGALTGRGVIVIPANTPAKSGKLTINVQAVATSPANSKEVEVLSASEATKLIWPSDSFDVIIGESVVIPVTFEDQYGTKVDAAAAWTELSAESKTISASKLNATGEITYTDGKITFDTGIGGLSNADLEGANAVEITLKAGKGDFITTKNITIKPSRVPSGITITKGLEANVDGSYDVSIINGQTVNDIVVSAVDQYGVGADADTGYYLIGKSTAGNKVTFTNYLLEPDVAGGHVVDLGGYTLKDPIKDSVGSFAGLSVVGASDGTATGKLTLSLMDANDKQVGKSIIINVTLAAAPSGFGLELATKGDITAGGKIDFTLTAKGSDSKALSTFNAKVPVVVYEGVRGNSADNIVDSSKYTNRVAEFKNGVATIKDVPVTGAGIKGTNGIIFGVAGTLANTKTIAATTNAAASVITDEFTVKHGDVARIEYNITTIDPDSTPSNGDEYNKVQLLLFDAGDNAIKDIDSDLVLTAATVKDATDTTLKHTDAVAITGQSAEDTLTAKKAGVSGNFTYTITLKGLLGTNKLSFKYGTVECTVK